MKPVFKLCGNCSRIRFNLTGQDIVFIITMYDRFNRENIEKSWVRDGNVRNGASKKVDKNNARFVQLSRMRRWCWKAHCFVAATEMGCAYWQTRLAVAEHAAWAH